MGQKRNNNNHADKHQKLESIPWYLCQKLDMLGHCCGHLIVVVHQSDYSTVFAIIKGEGRTSYCMPMPKLVEKVKSCDRINMTTRVCSLWLLFFKPQTLKMVISSFQASKFGSIPLLLKAPSFKVNKHNWLYEIWSSTCLSAYVDTSCTS